MRIVLDKLTSQPVLHSHFDLGNNLVNVVGGNVGIGTATPATKLSVVDNSANAAVTITQNGSGFSAYFPSATTSAKGFMIGSTILFEGNSGGGLIIESNGGNAYIHNRGTHTWRNTDSAKTLFVITDNRATFNLGTSNGQAFNVQMSTELTTIAAAATTDTAIQIPINAVVFAVSVRVVTVIPTAATFTVIGATSATAFNTAAVSTAADSTDVGTASCPYKNGAAQTIRITPNLTPAAATGQVRVTIHYYDITPPTG